MIHPETLHPVTPEPSEANDYGLYEISYDPDGCPMPVEPQHGPILFAIHSLDDENRARLLARAHRHYTTHELEALLPRAK
jgi:hypothetical protein